MNEYKINVVLNGEEMDELALAIVASYRQNLYEEKEIEDKIIEAETWADRKMWRERLEDIQKQTGVIISLADKFELSDCIERVDKELD